MNYQWDKEKAKANFLKHGVSFADAVAIFSDDTALTIEDDDPDEQRFVTIGMDAFGRVLARLGGFDPLNNFFHFVSR